MSDLVWTDETDFDTDSYKLWVVDCDGVGHHFEFDTPGEREDYAAWAGGVGYETSVTK